MQTYISYSQTTGKPHTRVPYPYVSYNVCFIQCLPLLYVTGLASFNAWHPYIIKGLKYMPYEKKKALMIIVFMSILPRADFPSFFYLQFHFTLENPFVINHRLNYARQSLSMLKLWNLYCVGFLYVYWHYFSGCHKWYSLLAREVNPAMVSTLRFYDRNELYGSPDVRNCRMPNFICWAFVVIIPISIN